MIYGFYHMIWFCKNDYNGNVKFVQSGTIILYNYDKY